MMNNLKRLQGTVKKGFHYKTMFKLIVPINELAIVMPNSFIAMIKTISIFVVRVTRTCKGGISALIRTEKLVFSFDSGEKCMELFVAKTAFDVFASMARACPTLWRTKSCGFAGRHKVNCFTFRANSREYGYGLSFVISWGRFNALFQRHILSPLKEMGCAVVHEAEASQHTPKRENFGYFVNRVSIA